MQYSCHNGDIVIVQHITILKVQPLKSSGGEVNGRFLQRQFPRLGTKVGFAAHMSTVCGPKDRKKNYFSNLL